MDRSLTALLLSLLLTACNSESASPDTSARGRPCPKQAPAPPLLPFRRPVHSLVDFWLRNRDLVEVGHEQIATQNEHVRALQHEGWPAGRWDPHALVVDAERVQQRLRNRIEALLKAVEQGKRVTREGRAPARLLKQLQGLEKVSSADELRVATRGTPLRCYPTTESLHDAAWQTAFDLNQCAWLRFGEAVRVLGKGPRFWYVWSSYADGWVEPRALTGPLEGGLVDKYLEPDSFVVVQTDRLAVWKDREGGQLLGVARLGLRLPLMAAKGSKLMVIAPRGSGLGPAWVLRADQVSFGSPKLTRRALFQTAFDLLNTPYGWGGTGGSRDCSRLMMDLFGAFGVLLPRPSWQQAEAGTRRVEVEQLGEEAKIQAIQKASRQAIVLLYLPGHIMLYLGRDGEHLYALHQFSGYLEPCPGGGETMMRLNRTAVTSLELGRGSSRKSFIERISRLVLFEPTVPPDRSPDALDVRVDKEVE